MVNEATHHVHAYRTHAIGCLGVGEKLKDEKLKDMHVVVPELRADTRPIAVPRPSLGFLHGLSRVQVMVKTVLPSTGATDGAGVAVTASDGNAYRALWQLTPPAAGQFNPPAATARVIIQRVISGVATTLNASDWADDPGIGATLSLTVWPDQRVTAKATTSTSMIRIDADTPGVRSITELISST